MIRRIAAFALAALCILPALAQAATWKIDPNHSSVIFTVRHLFTQVHGTFSQLSGSIEYDPAHPAASTVEAHIPASTVSTNNPRRDDDLKSEDFFEVTTYPELVFKSTQVDTVQGGLKVTGDLTMHGVTKPVVLSVQVLGTGPHPMIPGGQVTGFSAHTKINRLDYDIKWNKALDNGGTLVGDDVDIQLDIEAVNAPPKPAEPAKPGTPGKSG
jgi:polyisoprenoid-binding protein YceI